MVHGGTQPFIMHCHHCMWVVVGYHPIRYAQFLPLHREHGGCQRDRCHRLLRHRLLPRQIRGRTFLCLVMVGRMVVMVRRWRLLVVSVVGVRGGVLRLSSCTCGGGGGSKYFSFLLPLNFYILLFLFIFNLFLNVFMESNLLNDFNTPLNRH